MAMTVNCNSKSIHTTCIFKTLNTHNSVSMKIEFLFIDLQIPKVNDVVVCYRFLSGKQCYPKILHATAKTLELKQSATEYARETVESLYIIDLEFTNSSFKEDCRVLAVLKLSDHSTVQVMRYGK